MAIRFRICKNDTTDWLRATFGATPLRVPEARVQPLIVVAQKNKTTQFRGELHYLLEQPQAFNLNIREDPVADVALERTRKIDISTGMSILEGFLQGLEISPAAVGVALKGVREISFSFSKVQRRWADLGSLGLVLKKNPLDLSHPSVRIFTGDDPHRLLIISDAIVSRGFDIHIESGGETSVEAGIPAIQEYIAQANLNVKVSSNRKQSISFEGETPLTFAFTCVRAEFDMQTGAVSLMESVSPKSVDKAYDSGETEQLRTVAAVLDEVETAPGFLSWD